MEKLNLQRAICQTMNENTKDLQMNVNDREESQGELANSNENGNLVHWASHKQRVVALSSCEQRFNGS
ncbi:hypothetical protein Tco_0490935 [Tanacetum coccineum]